MGSEGFDKAPRDSEKLMSPLTAITYSYILYQRHFLVNVFLSHTFSLYIF